MSRTYSIGELTKELGLTARTLRHYEAEGLITPERRGQTRLYTARDRARISLILRGRRVGFTLAEIDEILDLYDIGDGGLTQLAHARSKFAERIALLERQQADIDASLADLRLGLTMIENKLADREPPPPRVRVTGYGVMPAEGLNMSPLQVEAPDYMTEDLRIFEDGVAKFLEREAVPNNERYIAQHGVDRALWNKAGEAGLLCASVPEEYGGAGGSFAHEAVIIDQLGKLGVDGWGIILHNAIVAPYILHYGTEDQKKRWLPRLATGELVAAIAMTEPGTGSDLQSVKTTAKRDGNQYLINGSKTFITNGGTANLIIVVAKTDTTKGAKGISLVCVETDDAEGFRRGRVLDKIGQKANDTAELFFDDVRVPMSNLIGLDEGMGFVQLMQQLPQERLIIALQAMAVIERALDVTTSYVKERKAFGKAVIEFQNTQFKLAECKTEATVAKVFCNHCMGLHLRGKLDATMASMAKLWLTDMQCKIVDECLQLHGGYGYMNEFPIARMYADSRVQKIYGGTNEIMKLLIARSL